MSSNKFHCRFHLLQHILHYSETLDLCSMHVLSFAIQLHLAICEKFSSKLTIHNSQQVNQMLLKRYSSRIQQLTKKLTFSSDFNFFRIRYFDQHNYKNNDLYQLASYIFFLFQFLYQIMKKLKSEEKVSSFVSYIGFCSSWKSQLQLVRQRAIASSQPFQLEPFSLNSKIFCFLLL